MPETNIQQIMQFVTTTIQAGATAHNGASISPSAINAFLTKYQPRFDRRFNTSGVGVPGWETSRANVGKAAHAHGVIAAAIATLHTTSGSPQVTTHILMDLAAPIIENECGALFRIEGPWCSE